MIAGLLLSSPIRHFCLLTCFPAWYGPFLEIAPGINLRHSPGHTPGLAIMQVNLADSGTFIFTTESVLCRPRPKVSLVLTLANLSQYHVKENWESDAPQGWLARDHDDWCTSHQMIKGLAKVRMRSRLRFGHECLILTMFPAHERECCTRPLCGDILEVQGGAGLVHLDVW